MKDIDRMNASLNTLPVLLVDDSQTMRSIVAQQLGNLGFSDIDMAVDGRTALDRLRERQYALMISDWEMEPMGGDALIKAVRQDPKNIKLPVIMITATGTRGASWLAGANAYLPKPFTEGDLHKAIKTVFGPR